MRKGLRVKPYKQSYKIWQRNRAWSSRRLHCVEKNLESMYRDPKSTLTGVEKREVENLLKRIRQTISFYKAGNRESKQNWKGG